MSYQATGVLIEIFDEQQVSEKFRKREIVVEIPGQYPEQIKFQLVQDKCSLVDAFQVNDEVMVTFNLRGRGFNKNGQMLYFTNLEAWKVEAHGATPQPQPRAAAARQQLQAQQPAAQQPAAAPVAGDDDNDLPF